MIRQSVARQIAKSTKIIDVSLIDFLIINSKANGKLQGAAIASESINYCPELINFCNNSSKIAGLAFPFVAFIIGPLSALMALIFPSLY